VKLSTAYVARLRSWLWPLLRTSDVCVCWFGSCVNSDERGEGRIQTRKLVLQMAQQVGQLCSILVVRVCLFDVVSKTEQRSSNRFQHTWCMQMISGGHYARLRFVRNGCRSGVDYFHHPRSMNPKLWARAKCASRCAPIRVFPNLI
jgi:hypothetical protein